MGYPQTSCLWWGTKFPDYRLWSFSVAGENLHGSGQLRWRGSVPLVATELAAKLRLPGNKIILTRKTPVKVKISLENFPDDLPNAAQRVSDRVRSALSLAGYFVKDDAAFTVHLQAKSVPTGVKHRLAKDIEMQGERVEGTLAILGNDGETLWQHK